MTLHAAKSNDQSSVARPINYELEAEVLGTPLATTFYEGHEAGTKALLDVLGLNRDDFAKDNHRIIYDAYALLSKKEELSPTITHLHQILLDLGKWDNSESGSGIGAALLTELQERGGIAAELPALCQIIKHLKWKRSVSEAAQQFYTQTLNWNEVTSPLVATCLDRAVRIYSHRPDSRKHPHDIATLLDQDILELERQIAGETIETRIWTGLKGLDRATGGLDSGNLVVLSGLTSAGKTSLGLDLALKTCLEKIGTAYFSFEMTSKEIVRRLMSKIARIDVLRLRNGDLADWQFDIYVNAAEQAKKLPMLVFDENLVPRQIEQEIQQLNRKLHPEQIRLIIIDHLQLMGSRDSVKYERPDLKLASYTGQLKDIAKANDCCVLLLSQFNRSVESRPTQEQRPRLSDLKGSGTIEQDADIVLALHRQDIHSCNPPYPTDLLILKNRNGPTGSVSLMFVPTLASFQDGSPSTTGTSLDKM